MLKRFGREPDGWAVLGRTYKFAPRALKNIMVEQLFVDDVLLAVCVVAQDSWSVENTGVRVWRGEFFLAVRVNVFRVQFSSTHLALCKISVPGVVYFACEDFFKAHVANNVVAFRDNRVAGDVKAYRTTNNGFIIWSLDVTGADWSNRVVSTGWLRNPISQSLLITVWKIGHWNWI